MGGNEAFSRVKIDRQLEDAGWRLTDGRSVRFEYVLPDGTKVDYVLCDRRGQAVAVLEAKRASVSLGSAEPQALAYAAGLAVPFVFLANGEDVRFRDLDRDAHFRPVATVFGQEDLERRVATRTLRQPPTSVAVDGRVAGRDYQRACIEVLCRGIEQGRRKLLVEMATGTGKTGMAAALIKRLFEAGWITRALFLVDRNTLAKQTEDAFAEHLPTLATYRVPRTGERILAHKQITICTLQTMINEYWNYSAGYFDLVVVDECHRSIYGEFRRVLDHFDAVRIGLTATPLVGDVPDDWDEEDRAQVRDTLRFFEVDRPTFRYTLKEAIDDGWLVPYRVYRARTVKTAAEGGFEVRRDEIDWAALDPETRSELEELFAGGEAMTVDPAALERKFTIPERNRAMAREFRDVLEKGYTGSDGVRRAPDLGKTIVFAVTKRHAETLARMLDDAFADRKPHPTIRYADFVVSGMGALDTLDAPALIRRFKKEEFPQILVSVNMLDTGFDCPEVVNLVMARFTKSGVLYQQMRGRGTRKADHIKKSQFTILDFIGNCDFHRDDDKLPGGVIVARPERLGPSQRRRLLTLDVHDEIDPTTREWIVYEADGTIRASSADEVRAERLGIAFEAFLADQEMTAEQERLARQIGEQVRHNAADMASFEAWRFTRPPFSLQGGSQRVLAAFGGADALAAFLAKLNAAVFGPASRASDERGKAPAGSADA
jgi:type I restriction enzyme R subunit